MTERKGQEMKRQGRDAKEVGVGDRVVSAISPHSSSFNAKMFMFYPRVFESEWLGSNETAGWNVIRNKRTKPRVSSIRVNGEVKTR